MSNQPQQPQQGTHDSHSSELNTLFGQTENGITQEIFKDRVVGLISKGLTRQGFLTGFAEYCNTTPATGDDDTTVGGRIFYFVNQIANQWNELEKRAKLSVADTYVENGPGFKRPQEFSVIGFINGKYNIGKNYPTLIEIARGTLNSDTRTVIGRTGGALQQSSTKIDIDNAPGSLSREAVTIFWNGQNGNISANIANGKDQNNQTIWKQAFSTDAKTNKLQICEIARGYYLTFNPVTKEVIVFTTFVDVKTQKSDSFPFSDYQRQLIEEGNSCIITMNPSSEYNWEEYQPNGSFSSINPTLSKLKPYRLTHAPTSRQFDCFVTAEGAFYCSEVFAPRES